MSASTHASAPDSPSTPSHAYVVRNTFIEYVDNSPTVLRRRRPSSLPPCAFFDPQGALDQSQRTRLESYEPSPLTTHVSSCSNPFLVSSSSSEQLSGEAVGTASDRRLSFEIIEKPVTAPVPQGRSVGSWGAIGDVPQASKSCAAAPLAGQSHERRRRGAGRKGRRGSAPALGGENVSSFTDGFNAGAASAYAAFNAGLVAARDPTLAVRPAAIDDSKAGLAQTPTPRSDVSTAEGSNATSDLQLAPVAVRSKVACQLIWCDQRAFKESSAPLRLQLETATGLTVKVHKCAEKCIRPLRKREHSQKQPQCVILASWTNAAQLLSYLEESPHVTAKVVLLSERCRGHELHAIDLLARSSPMVKTTAFSWRDAVTAAAEAVAEFQSVTLN